MVFEEWYFINCDGCDKPGYSDQYTTKYGKLLCARCFYPHLDFDDILHNA